MREFYKKNNSYECSSGSSVSSCVNEYDKSDKSSEMDARNLFIPEENYNDTANLLEDDNSLFQGAPSYVADYDYENDYNNTPLVYSFFPLVPGFVKKFDNSENNFNGSQNSITSIESFVVSNQDKKFKEYLEFNEHSRTHQNYETENLNNFDSSAFYQLDNSCNAMDINISRKKSDNTPTELSFGGKIKNLDINSLKLKIDKEKTEKERIHNESFEMLKKEDSSKMIFLNEKSPELFEKNVFKRCDKDNAVEKAYRSCSRFPQSSEEECELQILNKLNTSMNGICPPPSLTQYQMSLHDMLTSFKKNIIEPVISPEETQSNLFFKPSNTMKEVLKMEWPDVIRTKYHDIAYNKSTISEEIEVTCLRYCERFIGSETSSSFNNEVSSAKKRNDRLKLLARSPGKRLSHLAKRRSIFSSANLKTNCINGFQSTSITNRRILIDTTKRLFYQKSNKKNSPQKIASGQQQISKKNTPKFKDHPGQFIEKISSTRETSKRALFKSPLDKLTLNNNRKRIRSKSVENLNCENKIRRLNTSSQMQSDYNAKKIILSSRNDEHVKKRLFSGSHSDALPHSSSSSHNSSGMKQSMTTDIKRKLLWATSQSLASKQISKDHHKFKEYATLLVKLTKRLFTEFFCPNKSGRNFEDIYSMTKGRLKKSLSQKEFSYTANSMYEDAKQNEVRKTNAMLSFKTLSPSSEAFRLASNPTSTKNNETLASVKCSTSSSSKNNESFALRENFIRCNQRNSSTKTAVENEKEISSNNSTNLQKAKRQISF